MTTESKQEAIREVDDLKKECQELFDEIYSLYDSEKTEDAKSLYRTLALPAIYSIWERAFKTSTSIAIKYIQNNTASASDLKPRIRTLWFQKSSIYQKFLSNSLRKSIESKKAEKKESNNFSFLADFIHEYEEWTKSDLRNVDPDQLVMTFSNVNQKVIEFNESAIGAEHGKLTQDMDLISLSAMVGRRNDIGHGGLVTPPGKREFNQLFESTSSNTTQYCENIKKWLESSPLDKIQKQDSDAEEQSPA